MENTVRSFIKVHRGTKSHLHHYVQYGCKQSAAHELLKAACFQLCGDAFSTNPKEFLELKEEDFLSTAEEHLVPPFVANIQP